MTDPGDHLKQVALKFAELKQSMQEERFQFLSGQKEEREKQNAKILEMANVIASLNNQLESKKEIIAKLNKEKENKEQVIQTMEERVNTMIQDKRSITEKLRSSEEAREQEMLALNTDKQKQVEEFKEIVKKLEKDKTELLTKLNMLGNKLIES